LFRGTPLPRTGLSLGPDGLIAMSVFSPRYCSPKRFGTAEPIGRGGAGQKQILPRKNKLIKRKKLSQISAEILEKDGGPVLSGYG
jgi:hypothetical protein